MGDFIAQLALSAIRQVRSERSGLANKPSSGTAYILRSLKTPDEIEFLRNLYGKAFNVISVYASHEQRVKALSKRIAKSNYRGSADKLRHTAEELISIDGEEGKVLGQRVKDAFPLADFFVEISERSAVREKIQRFTNLLFGHPYLTPTRDEYAMFLAKASALRSSDLSRQVGALITQDDGSVISVGCNDVPKFGGGLYWTEDENDQRDFQRGSDPGAVSKSQILGELFNRLHSEHWLSEDKQKRSVGDLLSSVLTNGEGSLLTGTQVMSLIEFGRTVHAEMAAVSDAARRGVAIQNATLYSTTFPCHLCARHIIAAGIKRVVYIEPYPKSKAEELYDDSIVVNADRPTVGRVVFEPFVGVAPRRYFDLFEMIGERKNKLGIVRNWRNEEKNPRVKRFVLSYLPIEQQIVAESLEPTLKRIKDDGSIKS